MANICISLVFLSLVSRSLSDCKYFVLLLITMVVFIYLFNVISSFLAFCLFFSLSMNVIMVIYVIKMFHQSIFLGGGIEKKRLFVIIHEQLHQVLQVFLLFIFSFLFFLFERGWGCTLYLQAFSVLR